MAWQARWGVGSTLTIVLSPIEHRGRYLHRNPLVLVPCGLERVWRKPVLHEILGCHCSPNLFL